MESVADRHQWAIERGQEHGASVYQQAVLVFIAFRVGSENEARWPLVKIAEETRMKRNTVSKCLIWWVKEGVLKRTAQLRGPTIYELVQYPVERDIEPESSDESNIPSDVIQYPVERDAISRLTGPNIPSEGGLKEHKENVNEQEKDNMHTVIREHLDNCPDAERSKAIKHALDYWPDWWTKRPEEATSYYLENWGKFTDEVLRRSDTQEVEVDPADRSAYAGVNGIDGRRGIP